MDCKLQGNIINEFEISDKDSLDEEERKMKEQMKNPLESQKELAIKIKDFIHKRIDKELEEVGAISEFTRRWVETYNNMLDKMQRAIFGQKNINFEVKISHSEIAARMRQYL